MELKLEDLTVGGARIEVSNKKMTEKAYDIKAEFSKVDGALTRVDSGVVSRTTDGQVMATFWDDRTAGNNANYTFYNDAQSDISVKCELLQLIDSFVNLSIEKTQEEE